jgi:hypothetical protein
MYWLWVSKATVAFRVGALVEPVVLYFLSDALGRNEYLTDT